MALTQTSKLEAVNTMLSVIGEAPVNSLDASSKTVDVTMAEDILDEVSREVQTMGWNFNREYDVELGANQDNQIVLPTNTAQVDVEPVNSGTKQYVQRGQKIYNKTDRTFTITDSKKCTITYLLDWEDLPQPARYYISIRAARRFQERVVGSEKHAKFNHMDEFQALVSLREAETDGGDFTIFDNHDVFRVINRGNVINRISN